MLVQGREYIGKCDACETDAEYYFCSECMGKNNIKVNKLGFAAGQKAHHQHDVNEAECEECHKLYIDGYRNGRAAAFEEVIDYVIDMNSMSITLIQKKIIDWIEEKLQAAEGGKK